MRLTRGEMRGKVQTVLGLIDPADLGPTLMHEHLLWDVTPPSGRITTCGCGPDPREYWDLLTGKIRDPRNTSQRDHSIAKRAVEDLLSAGGKAVVELTVGGLVPDPEGLAWIAECTGSNIIMGCGHYVQDYQDAANHGRTVESFASEIMDQVQSGAWGTDVRAGIIGEIGCQWPWTDLEKRVLLGAIIAQQETGAALTIHPARHQDHPWELVEFLCTNGAQMTRTIIDHIDRTIFDDERLLRLADAGVILEWDLFGQENTYYPHCDIDMPNDGLRLRAIRRLIDRGYLEQIVISHDICHAIRLKEFGGHGYSHIQSRVLPHMRKRGFSQAEIEAIIVGNPRRLLTFA